VELDVEQLARYMNMSRVTLYRKIKAISDLTPIELINVTRLKKAAELLAEHDAKVDGFFVCPHRPEDRCDCRKPAAGLALRAAAKFDADLAESFAIGDKPCDIDLGRAIGATSILVRTGYGASFGDIGADHVVDGLVEAANLIGAIVGAQHPMRRNKVVSKG